MQWRNPKNEIPPPNGTIFIKQDDGNIWMCSSAKDVIWRDFIKGWLYPREVYCVLKKLKVAKERAKRDLK